MFLLHPKWEKKNHATYMIPSKQEGMMPKLKKALQTVNSRLLAFLQPPQLTPAATRRKKKRINGNNPENQNKRKVKGL